MIDRLLDAVNGSADRAGPMELAEILWLAARIPAEPNLDPVRGGDDAPSAPSDPPDAPEDGAGETGREAGRHTSTRLFSRGDAAGTDHAGLHGISVLVPKASAIDDVLGLMRSLRPLGQSKPVGADELNEEATVDRTVEQRMATPVMRAGQGRQLDLALVVDAHRSMLLWHDLVDELRQVVTHSGAFSDTRTWYLHGTDRAEKLELRGVGGAVHSPFEVTGQAGRRLILVVTDTIADGWGSSEVGELLGHWAKHNPVAILNVLPERLWKRGAARSVPTLLRNSTVGAPNRSWQATAPRISVRRRLGPTIPMVEATATTLGVLADLVAGSGRWHRLACLSFFPAAARQRDVVAPVGSEPAATNDPSRALARFQGSSSTIARRLAGYLAAVPLTVPVMTLVRRAMLPESENSHLAEVVLGGLFEPWRAVFGEVGADDLRFDFLPGVREALLGAQRRQDVAHVQELVRSHVWQYLQSTHVSGRHFLATQVVTADGVEEPETLSVPAGEIPFAEQSGHVVQEVPSPEVGFRAVKLVSADDEDGRALGTGFLLAPSLALTCGHVLTRRLGAQIYVDVRGWRSLVESLLISDMSDVALLALRDEMTALAFRDYHVDLSRDRELVRPRVDTHIEAFALTHDGRTRLGTVLADPADERQLLFFPSKSADRFRWGAGHSGTAVLCGDALLGLVIGQREGGTILVLRTSRIVEDERVRNMLVEHGVPLPDRLPDMPRSFLLCLAVKVDRREGQQPEQEQIRRVHRTLEAAGLSLSEAAFLPDAELVIELGSGREALKTLGNILQVLSQQASRDRTLPSDEWPGELTVAVGRMDRRAAVYLPEISAVEPVRMLDMPIPWSRFTSETRRLPLMRMLVSDGVFSLLRGQLSRDEIEQFIGAPDQRLDFRPILVYIGDTASLGRELAGQEFGGVPPAEEPWAAGDLGRAIPLYERILADRVRVLGEDHPDTLTSRNSLAGAYRAAGDLGRAIPLYEQILADRVRVLGEDHPDTLGSRNNLAGAYESAGDLGRAIPLYEQTLADNVRVLGQDHPNTLGSRNNLAGAYRAAGDLGRAIPLYEQILADRVRVLGEDHPDTLGSRNSLAGAYRAAGDLGRAIPLYEQILADRVRVLGEDHPDTLGSRNNLAGAYRAAGDLGRAIPLYEQTLADRVRVLGEDHPDTLGSRNNLAGAYRAAGDLGRAIPLYEQTLADRVRVLGQDHPNTLGSRNNLAGAYRAAGDLGRAIPLYEQTLADRVRVLGQDHPNTLGSRNNLAGAYESAGDLGRAIPLYEQTLADRVRVLGQDHPDTLGSRNNLAGAYRAAGDLGRAIPLYEQTLADRVRVLGEDHPDTLTSRNNLAGAIAQRGSGESSQP